MGLKVSRSEAFAAQGVDLKHPQRSSSGVREADGAVVIAIHESDIKAHFDGFSCLLWAPAAQGAVKWNDRAGNKERLEHCRLAARHGGADGLVVYGAAAQADRDAVLALRVENRRGEYWALWGSAACAPGLAQIHRQAWALPEAGLAA